MLLKIHRFDYLFVPDHIVYKGQDAEGGVFYKRGLQVWQNALYHVGKN